MAVSTPIAMESWMPDKLVPGQSLHVQACTGLLKLPEELLQEARASLPGIERFREELNRHSSHIEEDCYAPAVVGPSGRIILQCVTKDDLAGQMRTGASMPGSAGCLRYAKLTSHSAQRATHQMAPLGMPAPGSFEGLTAPALHDVG